MIMSSTTQNPRQKAVADALAGVIASVVSLWVFYPMDVYKTRVQASTSFCSQSQSSLLSSSWRDYFAGWKLKTVHTCASSFCFFYIYSWILSLWKSRTKRLKASSSTRLLLSAVAAMINTCLTLPLDVASSRLQAQQQEKDCYDLHVLSDTVHESDSEEPEDAEESKRRHEEKQSLNRNASEIPKANTTTELSLVSEIASLWKGLYPSLILCSNPAIHYTIFDSLKYRLLDSTSRSQLTMPQAFLLGLVAKFVATIATYPLIRVKVMLMVTNRTSLLGCLVDEYQQRGILAGWFQGCDLQLLHTLLKSALLMTVRERIKRTTRKLLLTP